MNLKTVTDSKTGDGNKISYAYDTSSKPTSVGLGTTTIAAASYDTFGNNNLVTLANNITYNVAYDSSRRVDTLVNKLGDSTISAFDYSYDTKGNITNVTEADGSLVYQYDDINRLVGVTNKDASQVTYTYDSVGNRLTKVDSSGTTSYSYDNANELTTVTKTGETITFTYDDRGNTTSRNSSVTGLTTYSYDNNNNPVKVNLPNADVVEISYTADGKRYMKKVTSGSNTTYTYYQYDSKGNVVLETYKDEQEEKHIKVKYVRDNTGKALAQEQNGNMYYYLYNAHGDVTALTDNTGTVVATYTYDEFGNLKLSTGSIYNPLRYSGANNAYYDAETGLYKMGCRYYNPEVGRWITRDWYKGEQEQPQGLNRYIYCENNPINKVDITGHWAEYYHLKWTMNAAKNVGYPSKKAEIIALANINVDINKYSYPLTHESSGYGSLHSSKTYVTFRAYYNLAIQKGSIIELGHSLHYLQDYYAHLHLHNRGGYDYYHSYHAKVTDEEKNHPWRFGVGWKVDGDPAWRNERSLSSRGHTQTVLRTAKPYVL